MLPGVSSRVGL